MDFGKRIQMKRKALGLSVEELARRAKCSKGLIAQWECGLLPKKLNKGKIAQVKRILKVRVSGTKRHIAPPRPVTRPRLKPRLSDGDRILRSIGALHLEMSKLRLQMAALGRKPSQPVLPKPVDLVPVKPETETVPA